MNETTQTKICQNCRADFAIAPEDFAFYEKLEVPPPTWCPRCRLKRRLAFMNERSLYKRKCDLCAKEVLSIFSPEVKMTVYCPTCWWSDGWDPMAYGRDYDFSRPFFSQFKEFLESVPHISRETLETTLVNSDYCNICSYLKNCYLVFNSDYDEDCAYSSYLERSKNCFDVTMGDLSELCYESNNIFKCNRVLFSDNCNECIDVAFSKDMVGCSNCFGCVGLRSKQYYIFNQPYTKEQYKNEIEKYNLGSYTTRQELYKKVSELSISLPKRYMHGLNNANVTGDYIFNSKNVSEGYECTDTQDAKYCHFLFIASTKDAYDYTMWGGGAERMYECMGSGGGQSDVKFSYECWGGNSRNLEYCMYHAMGSDLFGCVSVRSKQYCILNKQYSKEEYEMVRAKIIEQMTAMPYVDARGRSYAYGEFFPLDTPVFNYRETMAQMYFPLTQVEVTAQGFEDRAFEQKRNYAIDVSAADLPDDIKDVTDEILQKVISCEHAGTCKEQCSTAFRIIPVELEFYRRLNVPLPRLCSNCRHYRRLSNGNGLDLYARACMCNGQTGKHFHGAAQCPNQFETSYAPERAEVVYCEQCYQAEIV